MRRVQNRRAGLRERGVESHHSTEEHGILEMHRKVACMIYTFRTLETSFTRW